MVFASLPLHAFFGVVLMGMQAVMGVGFYRSLQLPWHTDFLVINDWAAVSPGRPARFHWWW